MTPPSRTAGDQPKQTVEPEVVKFSPQEEQALLEESNAIKAEANELYSAGDFENALSRYEDAVATCPNYLHYERAVLHSNMAACHLQQEQWSDAIKIASKALDSLEQAEPGHAGVDADAGADAKDSVQEAGNEPPAQTESAPQDDGVEEEVVSSGASRAAPAPALRGASSPSETRRSDILRIRSKALLRRARARCEAGGWQNLAGAEDDYRLLSDMPGLGPADARTVRRQLAALPPRTKAAREKEMSEMWGKLKTLGDGILKPFGLSTDNFQMVKDEKSGGYSMNFTSGDGSSKAS
ncbi:uncharacterized protein UV8b_00218 [Ustilaginoidea virens]|uniref:Uncharacterized protein n=1 Tax=Ustilaginoidea virens TaxID=1159556 RepID=A0A1B5L1P1_USTVR|nr:uncharacterized protein UV8b_00218 [Ustilaginoidea virens]QUC15977.1 hypothetical protein UV8b_00218 [Ustilaginoidea virens]GAO17352.1 hypothetical protein UVI_02038720 [Ustilaginoidea virens]